MAAILEQALQANIADRIDPDVVSEIVSQPPWIHIDGVCNARDLGSDAPSSGNVRKGYVYRAGMLERITERGKDDLKLLGIKKIFDLRSAAETAEYPDPQVPGIEVVEAAVGATLVPFDSVKFTTQPPMYMAMLVSHKDAWRSILEHVRDHPDQPFLFHCTGGKDRTGVAAAVILSLAGATTEEIAQEYAITRIGVEPMHEALTYKFTGGKAIDMTGERFQAMAKITADTMEIFLQEIDSKYGSVPAYVDQVLGMSGHDTDIIRRNLKEDSSSAV